MSRPPAIFGFSNLCAIFAADDVRGVMRDFPATVRAQPTDEEVTLFVSCLMAAVLLLLAMLPACPPPSADDGRRDGDLFVATVGNSQRRCDERSFLCRSFFYYVYCSWLAAWADDDLINCWSQPIL